MNAGQYVVFGIPGECGVFVLEASEDVLPQLTGVHIAIIPRRYRTVQGPYRTDV
ncbi:hypothetical protein [Nocardia terpenica]|uniref:Uncharacterized protein n=1 Tax=Nocardia terpenica TaxID=455432 RepID=A0A6G9Z8R6_9NOCA|nr:hypothetical protein [Nocardia terpenica]QIS21854.1 hypothetical protein F6W96_29520 [Nocardia terpenica]